MNSATWLVERADDRCFAGELFVVVGSCANIRDINWLGDDIGGLESCDLFVSKVKLACKRANQLTVDVLGSLLLDGGVGTNLLSIVFGEEFTRNAVAEDSGIIDTLALGFWCIRAYRSLGSLLGRSLSFSGCLGFNIRLVGEGGQNQEDNDSVDDGEDDTVDEMVLDRASQEVVAVDKEGEGHF